MKENKLEYYVYTYDTNKGDFEKFNIFNSSKFYRGLTDIKAKMKKEDITFEMFNEELLHSVRYSFWGKCEYEILLVDLFCVIDRNEIERIKQTKDNMVRTSINPASSKKIDVAEQLLLNWDIFAKYVWENMDLIPVKTKKTK